MKNSRMKLARGEMSLRLTAIILSFIFGAMMLYPLAYTIGNSMKDNRRIYDVPPSIWPNAAQSMSVVLEYQPELQGDGLKDTLQRDAVLAMFGLQYKLADENLFEIRFYARQNDKIIFYARAHQTKLQMERDYGIYKDTVIKPNVLLLDERYQRACASIGFQYDPNGLSVSIPDESDDWTAKAEHLLADSYPVTGKPLRLSAHTDNKLLLESFRFYWEMPSYVYRKSPVVAQFGFLAFVMNTVIVIGFAILSQVILCSICAFVISRLLKPRAARLVLLYFLGGMMIPFASVMLPQLIMFRQMGAYNNYAALLLPFLYPYGFYVFLYKGFFDKIPSSYFEAAKLDGASNFYLYRSILMPLSKPIIALIALQTFIGNWNDFFWAWMVTEDPSLWTLNVALFNLSNNLGTKQNAILGLSIMTTLPVILLSIVFSKQLKQSITASGVKG